MFLTIHKKIIIFLLCLTTYSQIIFAENISHLPHSIPLIHGINVLTGLDENSSLSETHFEKYVVGLNQIGEKTVFLNENDFRIDRIKTIHLSNSDQDSFEAIHFLYDKGVTRIYDFPGRISLYHYHEQTLQLNSIEHYLVSNEEEQQLYRSEHFYWDKVSQDAKMISRVLQDGEGNVFRCYCFFYDQNGNLIKETLFGQLSGDSSIPCLIGDDGRPIDNGVESYDTPISLFNDDSHPKNLNEKFDDKSDANDELLRYETYNAWGQIIKNRDDYGNETIFHYDSFGRLIRTNYPEVFDEWDQVYQPSIQQKYDICDQIIEIIDAKGVSTHMEYNVRGQPLKITYPDGSFESYRYYLDGILKEKRTPDGMRAIYKRDDKGLLIEMEKQSFSGVILQSLTHSYQNGFLDSISDAETTVRFFYDKQGRQTGLHQKTADGTRRLEWSYDEFNQKTQTKEWYGSGENDFVLKTEKLNSQQTFEDANGNCLSLDLTSSSTSMNFVLNHTSVKRNSIGQFVKQEEKINACGVREILSYDALERLESRVIYNAMGIQIAEACYRYDGQGNKVLEKHQVIFKEQPIRQYKIRWNYDHCKRIISVAEEENQLTKTTRYHYNSFGQIEELIKPDGTRLIYSYGNDGKLHRFFSSDHSFDYEYEYDHLYRLSSIYDHCHDLIQMRRYNAFNELIGEELHPGVHVGHAYDLAGRRIRMTLPDKSHVHYHYEGLFLTNVERLSKTSQSLYEQKYLYNQNGYLQSSQLLKDLGFINYQYGENHQLKNIESPWYSQKVENNSLDECGRLVSLTTIDSAGEHKNSFSYTEDGQLASEEGHQYAYDSLYNRLSDNDNESIVNGLNQIIQTHEGVYKYDLNGNLIEKSGESQRTFYTYDALNRLIRVEYPQEKAISYTYDAFDRRLSRQMWSWNHEIGNWKLLDSNYFIYDGFKEIGTFDSEQKIEELRILGKGPGAELGATIAIELGGKLYLPLHDFSGSIALIVDVETKKVVESYRFSAYGNMSVYDENGNSIENSLIKNPWGFCSKRKDLQTGLIYFGKRDLDPQLGRWITPDPLLFCDTANLYAFVKNDPVNHRDLYGTFSFSSLWNELFGMFCNCFQQMQSTMYQVKDIWTNELKLNEGLITGFEKLVKTLLGETTYLLMGFNREETRVNVFGDREISDKVRVSFINGILNTHEMLLQSLQLISETHGGVKVHYIFRPTNGWTWDISRAILIKTAFTLGFRSSHAYLLASLWRKLINEVGGIGNGGIVLHYAHSLGGSETDRARDLLSEEEQRMIRVVTFGSVTLIRNTGFESVINVVSRNDGVSSLILEPFGHIRSFFDPDSNVQFYGSLSFHGFIFGQSSWPADHLLNGPTYGAILSALGKKFIAEFSF